MTMIEWENLDAWPVVLIAAICMNGVIGWGYHRQVRSLNGLLRWVLPALRLLVVLALAASVLKPVLERPATQAQQGAVVIVVDGSQSMGVSDARSPAERVALARSLGDLPAAPDTELSAMRDRLAELTQDMANYQLAQEEVRFARASGRAADDQPDRQQTALEKLLADCRRLAEIHPSPAEPKLDLAWRALSAASVDRSKLEPALNVARNELAQSLARQDTALFNQNEAMRATANRIGQKTRLDLALRAARRLISQLPTDVPAYLYLAGEKPLPLRMGDETSEPVLTDRTDSESAMDQALARLSGTAVRGIVLFSDGRQVQPKGDVDVARNIPIFAVNSAASSPPEDVAVSIISAQERLFVGQMGQVRVKVRSSLRSTSPLDVHFDAGSTQKTENIPLDAAGEAEAVFSFSPEQSGIVAISASVTPFVQEATTANNRATNSIRAVADKIHVAAFAGTPSKDFQNLQALLQHKTWLQSDATAGILNGATFPLSPAQILSQDVLVLCDIPVAALNTLQWDAVGQLATARGGGVIVLANDEAILNGYADQPQAANLLPQRPGVKYAWHRWSGQRPALRVEPPGRDDEYPAIRLLDDPAASFRRWQELDPLFAVVPLVALKPGVQPLLIETESRMPVVTETKLGAGRSIFVGLNETWRWAQPQDGDQERLLTQLIVEAAGQTPNMRQVAPPLQELDDVSPDPVYLQQLADSSGGASVHLEEVNQLVPQLIAAGPREYRYMRYPLWDSPQLFVLVLAALTAEWAARKWMGLA
jgi:hypothetical protein